MDHLSSLDAAFLDLENDRQQMHVGSLLLFEPPAPPFEHFNAHLGACLDVVPRYRQHVLRMPLDLSRPAWVDDPHFSLAYHLRHTAVPPPGSSEQLRALMGRIMSQRLDVDRPLWEMWLVEGLDDGRWAVITKTHHAMIDGLAGNELMETVLDRRSAATRRGPRPWVARPRPSDLALAASSAAAAARVPVQIARAAARGLASPGDVVKASAVRMAGLASVGRSAVSPTSVLNGHLGPHRRWGWARAELADVKKIKDAAGCTVNDVVLAAVAGGFRTFLLSRGVDVHEATVRSLVPVSVRAQHSEAHLGNQVTAMFAELPVGVADPLERLAAVTQQMDHLKHSGQAIGVNAMLSAANHVPALLMMLGARVYMLTGQRVVNTVTTNIPGPQYPLYLLGRRMLEMYPYIPVAQDVRISVGIMSYDGHLAIGVTADYDAVPDLDVLCVAIETCLAELADHGQEARLG